MIQRSLLEMPRILPKRKCVRSTGTRLYLSRMMPEGKRDRIERADGRFVLQPRTPRHQLPADPDQQRRDHRAAE